MVGRAQFDSANFGSHHKFVASARTLVLCLTFSYGPQHQNARLLDNPVGVEEQAFQER